MIALMLAAVLVSQPVEWQPFTGEAFDGSPLRGERTTILAPLHPAQPNGPQVELAVVRYRTRNPNPSPPIFFLAGGPGGSGVDLCASPATHPQIRLLEHADVIGIDQRGTGRSVPNLMEPVFPLALPYDQPLTRASHLDALRKAAERAAAYWTARGVDLSAFHTTNSAHDFEVVRRALKLNKIVLFGGSYGSHLGLAYLRDHGAHVDRAIFTSVEGPDDTWKLPRDCDAGLEQLHQRLAASPAWRDTLPDLRTSITRLLAELQAHPQKVACPDAPNGTVVLGPYDLQLFVARSLSTSDGVLEIPPRIRAAERDNWQGLAETVCANRQAGLRTLPLVMDCASGGSGERLQQLNAQRASGLPLDDVLLAPLYPDLCEHSPTPSVGPRHDAFRSDVPLLLVSGSHDVRTPPRNAAQLLPGFTQAAQVRVQNAGHEGRGLMARAYRDLLQGFLRGEPVVSCEIVLPPPVLAKP